MKRKHIISVVLIISIIYLPFLFRCIRQLEIALNSSDYIIVQASVTEINFYGRHCNVIVEFDRDGRKHTDVVLDKIGDYVGMDIELAIHKKTGSIYRNDLVIGYQDISLSIVGLCLLLLENYSYTNKKKRYKRRKELERNQTN